MVKNGLHLATKELLLKDRNMKQLITYIVACLWCWATLIPLQAQSLRALLSGNVASAVDYIPYGAVFDGTNDYLQYSDATNNPIGMSDSKAFMCSFWIKFNGGDATAQCILDIGANFGASSRLVLQRTTANKLIVSARNQSNTIVISVTTTTSITTASGLTHVFIVMDTTTGVDIKKVYINGVSDSLTVTTFTLDGIIDLAVFGGTSRQNTIGATAGALQKINADLFEFWFDDVAVDDVTKFYNSGAVDLGASGANPTGTPPVHYFSRGGNGDAWNSNSSGGSSFTLYGTLGTPSVFP